jgi:carboxyl-terminal processing protease
MAKKVIIIFVSVCLAVVLFAGGFVLGFNITGVGDFFSRLASDVTGTTQNDSQAQVKPDSFVDLKAEAKSLSDTIDFIEKNAIKKKTRQELIAAAIEGMLSSLDDKYAEYFPKDEYSKIMDSYSGTTSGIGIVVTVNDKKQVIIVNTIEDTSAFEKGLKTGDIITGVNGASVEGLALEKVVSMIKGQEGTTVSITILRPSENKNMDFTVERRRFYVPNFYASILDESIIYVQYADFQDQGAQKLEEKLKTMVNEQTTGIILDLRNNLGGILDDAVGLCDLFLDGGTVVTVKGRKDNKDSFEEFKAAKGGYTNIPMIVLINGYSASASELAAGALKDLGRAKLIGEKSYGKGTVQILEMLPDGSGLKFTTAKYYLPSGVTIDGTGIQPDIIVVLKPEDTVDLQLNKALEEIKKMAATVNK